MAGRDRRGRALFVGHGDDLDPGVIGECAERSGLAVERHLREDGTPYPDPTRFDLVVPLGSAWSVTDPAVAEPVRREQRFLAAAVEAGVPLLAICFGAQQLAAALGGRVQRAVRPEIGWTTVDTDDPSTVPAGPWMQFHTDAFEPPPGAQVLARTDVCPQAYRIGSALAVQFHPEVTVETLRRWWRDDHHVLAAHLDEQRFFEQAPALASGARRHAQRLFDAVRPGATAGG